MVSNKNFRVLITDLNHHIRDLMSRELKREGYDVICAGNAADFFRMLEGQRDIDVIILDPELFQEEEQTYLNKLQALSSRYRCLIVHAYLEFQQLMTGSETVFFVEKTASSITPLNEAIRRCCAGITTLSAG